MLIEVNDSSFSFSWNVGIAPAGSLRLSTDASCPFRQFIKIVADQDFCLLPEKYTKMNQHFVSSSHSPLLTVPRHELRNRFQAAEEAISRCLSSWEDSEYFLAWSKIDQFLSSMQPAKVDATALTKLFAGRPDGHVGTLATFSPGTSGFAPVTRYCNSNTVTGRLSVLSGPHILTAPREIRNCLRSSFGGGSVLTVDFTSIEPRVALLSVGKLAPEDVYSDILEEFQGIGRQTAKAVTLIALYGGQVNRLSGVVGDTEKARKAVSFVRSHFRVNELEAKLSRQAELGLVRNIFGRPLREATKNARVRTNHYLQSSAAELAPTLFSELCQKFSHGVRPLFVIHDALVVDVAADVEHEFRQQAVTIAWDGSRFPVKIEKLDHT